MNDNGTTITIKRPEGLGLEWEVVDFRPPLEGEHYWADDSVLVASGPRCTHRLILRKREPQPGQWQEGHTWTGEICYGRDLAGRLATSDRSNWVANDYSQSHFSPKLDHLYFILCPKANPRLSEEFNRWRSNQGPDDWGTLIAKLEAREKVIAEVISKLREDGMIGCERRGCADKLEDTL